MNVRQVAGQRIGQRHRRIGAGVVEERNHPLHRQVRRARNIPPGPVCVQALRLSLTSILSTNEYWNVLSSKPVELEEQPDDVVCRNLR